MTGVLKEGRHVDTVSSTQREHHVKNGFMLLQGVAGSKGTGLDSSFLEPSEGAWPRQHLDLRFPAPLNCEPVNVCC